MPSCGVHPHIFVVWGGGAAVQRPPPPRHAQSHDVRASAFGRKGWTNPTLMFTIFLTIRRSFGHDCRAVWAWGCSIVA